MYSLSVPEENNTPEKLNIDLEIERLIDSYGSDVLRTSYLYLKDKQLAEDAFQEVFIKVYKKYDSFEHRSSEKTWLISITINVCKNILRGSWIKRVLLIDKMDPDKDSASFDNDLIKKDDNKLLFDAVMSLPVTYKDVVILFYYQDYDTIHISKILGIAEGTVRSRLHRARKLLKDKIDGRVEYNG